MFELIHGDCIEIMKDIEPGSIDMVLADPPYGTTQCRWDSIIPLEQMWEQLKRVIKSDGAIVMTSGQPFTSALIMSNVTMFKYCWVWNKVNKFTGALNASRMPMLDYEDVPVFYEKQPIYNKQLRDGSYKTRHGGDRNTNTVGYVKPMRDMGRKIDGLNPKRILDIPSHDTSKSLHPTKKPVALMEYLIKTYTKDGDTVLDFVMGSGTTGVACKNLHRKFIGVELDEKYFNTAKERIEKHSPALIV